MAKKFVVTTPNRTGSALVGLRGTVWAFHMSRADKFDTMAEAEAALLRAKPFMQARTYKACAISEVDEHDPMFDEDAP